MSPSPPSKYMLQTRVLPYRVSPKVTPRVKPIIRMYEKERQLREEHCQHKKRISIVSLF